MSNPVGWFEIYVDDLAKALSFYQGVLQTELIELPMEEAGDTDLVMWQFPNDMEKYGASGAICKMTGIEPGGMGTHVYFTCEDCAEEASRVAEFGGKVMKPKFSIGEHGYISMCTDPAGNMIGLHSMK